MSDVCLWKRRIRDNISFSYATNNTAVWFDDVGISEFYSSVVVDLHQSLSEWRLLLSHFPNVFWCVIERMCVLLVKLGKSGSKIMEMLMQVYADNTLKKTAVHK
jgi:hypothetical protein